MCSENYGSGPVAGECDECGADVDAEGEAVEQCAYGSKLCEVYNFAPCDGAC